MDKTDDMAGLNFVDFCFLPHLNSGYFEKLREPGIREAVKEMGQKVYALDDESALKVVDGKVEVVSEGKWFMVEG